MDFAQEECSFVRHLIAANSAAVAGFGPSPPSAATLTYSLRDRWRRAATLAGAFAGADDLVFAGYNDVIGYGAIVTISAVSSSKTSSSTPLRRRRGHFGLGQTDVTARMEGSQRFRGGCYWGRRAPFPKLTRYSTRDVRRLKERPSARGSSSPRPPRRLRRARRRRTYPP